MKVNMKKGKKSHKKKVKATTPTQVDNTLSDVDISELIKCILNNFRYEKIFIELNKSFVDTTCSYDQDGNLNERVPLKYLSVDLNSTYFKPNVCFVDIYKDETQDECYKRCIREINDYRKKIQYA